MRLVIVMALLWGLVGCNGREEGTWDKQAEVVPEHDPHDSRHDDDAERMKKAAEDGTLFGYASNAGNFSFFGSADTGVVKSGDEHQLLLGLVFEVPSDWFLLSLDGTATITDEDGHALWTGPFAWSAKDGQVSERGPIGAAITIRYDDANSDHRALRVMRLSAKPNVTLKLSQAIFAGGVKRNWP
jgi:hypothetical protein